MPNHSVILLSIGIIIVGSKPILTASVTLLYYAPTLQSFRSALGIAVIIRRSVTPYDIYLSKSI